MAIHIQLNLIESMDSTTLHEQLAMWGAEASGTKVESLIADLSRILKMMNEQGLTRSKSQLAEWSMELGLETKATDTAKDMRRRIYGEINDRLEDGLREQAGGTNKPRKVTQKPKVISAEGMESPRKKNEETGEANGMAEDKMTTATNGMGTDKITMLVDGTTTLTETKVTPRPSRQWWSTEQHH